MSLKKENAEYYIVLALLFFQSMNFYGKFFYFVFFSLIILIIFEKNIIFNKMLIPYLLLGLLMAMYNVNSGIFAIIKCFSYAALYLVGYNLTLNGRRNLLDTNKKATINENGYKLILAMAMGSFLHFFLNFIINIGNNVGRNTIDIWSGEILSATGQIALTCIITGLSIALLLQSPKKIWWFFGFTLILLMLLYNLTLACRTLFVSLGLVIVIGYLFLIKSNKKYNHLFKNFIFILFALVIIYVIYNLNAFGLKDLIMNSNLYKRFFDASRSDLVETGRTEAKINFVRNLIYYPFGGLNLRNKFGYAHDLLLDAYDEYGILSTCFLLIILFDGLKQLYLFCNNKMNSIFYKLVYLCVYTSVIFEFFMEPIFAGMPWLFVCFSAMNGSLAAQNRFNVKKIESNIKINNYCE